MKTRGGALQARDGAVRVDALAKINLTLRVLGRRADGYHEIRTAFQSIALRDTLVFERADGPFALACSDPLVPGDGTNLVWRAADALWRRAGRRGKPQGVRVTLVKGIPSQAGLGGGSSDAAATLRALERVWRLDVAPGALPGLAASLGADVPFFLHGGTALGVNRGDIIFPLPDIPSRHVVIVLPAFGVGTADAYRWFDEGTSGPRRTRPIPAGWTLPPEELGNDLEPPVTARHPAIGRLVRALERRGAAYAAMSGSGSAVFGIFDGPAEARDAAHALSGPGIRTVLTRTLTARQARLVTRIRA